MHPEPFDFRKPAPLPAAVGAPLADWLAKVCQTACKQWASLFSFAVEMEPAGLEVTAAARALEGVPESAPRFRAALSGTAEASLLVLPRPLLLALLGGLLGEAFDPAQPDREL